MDINLQAGAVLPRSLPGARSADTPVVKSDAVAAPRVPNPEAKIVDVDQQRYEQLVRAAQAMLDDVFAVSDTTFSIFKDQSGQYITRFTSLRDGRVTYIPEPDVLQYIQNKQRQRQALVQLQV